AAASVYGDIRQPAIREEVQSLARGVDVVIGGPPCQAFSQVRNHDRALSDPRNVLYREFLPILQTARPLAFLMETGRGMAQLKVVGKVSRQLEMDGEYRVTPRLVEACHFGVPQTRKRLVFMALHRSLGAEPPDLVGRPASEVVSLVRRGQAHIRYQ